MRIGVQTGPGTFAPQGLIPSRKGTSLKGPVIPVRELAQTRQLYSVDARRMSWLNGTKKWYMTLRFDNAIVIERSSHWKEELGYIVYWSEGPLAAMGITDKRNVQCGL